MPKKKRALPDYTTATLAANTGESVYRMLENLRDLASKVGVAGVRTAAGKPLDEEDLLTKVKYFSDILKEAPGQFRASDLPGSLPVIPGSPQWTEKQKQSAQADFERFAKKTGAIEALPPIAKVILRGGERVIPSGIIGKEKKIDVSLPPETHPLINAAAGLGSLAAKGIIKGTTTGTPSIASRASAMDIIKPPAGFIGDVVTDPLTMVGGVAGKALKGIKSAASNQSVREIVKAIAAGKNTGLKSGLGIGKQTFEAFGEAYPRFVQMISPMFGAKDTVKVYNFLRSPSKLISSKLKRARVKAARNIDLFEQHAEIRGKAWAEIKDHRIRIAIGKVLEKGGYKDDYKVLQRFMQILGKRDPAAVAQFKDPVKDVVKIAKDLRRLMTRAGQAAVGAGLLEKATFEKNKDKYVRRLFRHFVQNEKHLAENPDAGLKFLMRKGGGGAGTVNTSLFKAKKELTPKKLKKLGVLGPEAIGFSAVEGSKKTVRAAQNAMMFRELADSSRYAIKKLPRRHPKKAFKLTGSLQSKIATIKGKEYVQIPNNYRYGSLRGRWIPRNDAEALVKTNKEVGKGMKAYLKALGIWKTFKVPFSPSAMGRNVFMGNPLLMIFSGVPAGDAFKRTLSAATKFADKGFNTPAGRAFVRYGGVGRSFSEAELVKAASGLKSGLAAKAQTGISKVGELYGASEAIAKIATMEYYASKGMSYRNAFKKAQEILFDYSDVSGLLNVIRKSPVGYPFVTFPSKAMPLVFKSLLSNPTRVISAIAARDVWNKNMIEKLGLAPEDVQLIRERYGDWFLITGGDKERPQITDLAYIFPGNEALGAQPKEGTGGWIPGAPTFAQPSGPLLSFAEVSPQVNTSAFFGSKIVRPEDLSNEEAKEAFLKLRKTTELDKEGKPKELGTLKAAKAVLPYSATGKRLRHLWRSLAPANPLVPGTYQQEKLKSATAGTPLSYSGDIMDPWTAWLSELGFKSAPMDLNKSQFYKAIKKTRNIKDVVMALAFLGHNLKLSEETRDLRGKLLELLIEMRQGDQ